MGVPLSVIRGMKRSSHVAVLWNNLSTNFSTVNLNEKQKPKQEPRASNYEITQMLNMKTLL
jgi:hypothetical protein